MIRRRIDVSARLLALSPLHVGESRTKSIVLDRSRNVPTEVRTIQRDGSGNPWIPGSSLKGMMRRLITNPEQLFGSAKTEGGGEESLVRVFGATWTDGSEQNLAGRPYAQMDGRVGSYIAAQTMIDPAGGVADDHKLFLTELVAEGAIFEFRAALIWAPGRKQDQEDLAGFAEVLAAMISERGFQIGHGAADGFGQMRLVSDSVGVEDRVLVAGEGLVANPSHANLRQQISNIVAKSVPRKGIRLELNSKTLSPFAILDSSHSVDGNQDRTDPDRVQLKAQRSGTEGKAVTPLVHGPSLMGALRARADWLLRLHNMRAEATTEMTIGDKALLELFGETGRRAKLQLRTFAVADGSEQQRVTSVKIDRFSGAPMDGGLFTIDAFRGVNLKAELDLDGVSEDANRLAQLLWQDLNRSGVSLGYGASRGFGWFEVQCDAGEEARP